MLLVIAYVWVTCRERLWWMLPQMLALALAIMSLATMTIYQSQGSGDICLYDPNPIKFELRKNRHGTSGSFALGVSDVARPLEFGRIAPDRPLVRIGQGLADLIVKRGVFDQPA